MERPSPSEGGIQKYEHRDPSRRPSALLSRLRSLIDVPRVSGVVVDRILRHGNMDVSRMRAFLGQGVAAPIPLCLRGGNSLVPDDIAHPFVAASTELTDVLGQPPSVQSAGRIV